MNGRRPGRHRHRPAQTATFADAARLYATLGDEHLRLAEEMIGRAVLAEPRRNVSAVALRDEELRPIPDLPAFLDRLASVLPDPPDPVGGDDALRLIERARLLAVTSPAVPG